MEDHKGTSGTVGQSKRLEAIKIALKNQPYDGSIEYRTHIEKIGWTDFVQNGHLSGTVGQTKRLEGIELKLKGQIADYFDVYYRTHIQSFGWLGCAKNGMPSGSEGLSRRIEAIEIKLVEKNKDPKVNSKDSFKTTPLIYIDIGHGGVDSGARSGGVFEKQNYTKNKFERAGLIYDFIQDNYSPSVNLVC